MYHIIFDFDGVIGNTFEPFAEFLATTSRISIPKARQKVFNHSLNNNRPSVFKTLIKTFYIRKFSQFLKSKGDLINHNVMDIVSNLTETKYIVSRNHSVIPKQLLGDDIKFFRDVYGYNNSKNKIRAIKKIQEKNSVPLDKIIFVTDTVGDVREVSKYLKPDQIIVVSWGFNSREVLSKYIPSCQIVDEPKELILKFKQITSS